MRNFQFSRRPKGLEGAKYFVICSATGKIVFNQTETVFILCLVKPSSCQSFSEDHVWNEIRAGGFYRDSLLSHGQTMMRVDESWQPGIVYGNIRSSRLKK
jgi:hypothetical protein